MKSNKLVKILTAALFLAGNIPQARAASVPLSFTHHGLIWDGKNLVDGEVDMEATLYDVSGEEKKVVATARDYVPVEKGYYSITIGKIKQKSLIAAKGQLKLQLTVAGKVLEPMLPVSSVPFAMLAGYADHANTADSASDITCEGCVTLQNLAEGIQNVINSADEHGAINNIAAAAVGDAEISFNYAGSTSKGGDANRAVDLACGSKSGCVDTGDIINKNVTLAKLEDSVQKSLALADSSIQKANNAVLSEYINGGAVTSNKIADYNVTEGKIANGAVTSDKLSVSAVTTAKIADSNITTAKIADSAVTTDKVDFNWALGSSKGGNAKVADLANSIKDGIVTQDKLKNIYAALAYASIEATYSTVYSYGSGGTSAACVLSSVTVNGKGITVKYTAGTYGVPGSATFTMEPAITNPVIVGNIVLSEKPTSTTFKTVFSHLASTGCPTNGAKKYFAVAVYSY